MQPKLTKILICLTLLMIVVSSISAQSLRSYIKAADNSFKSGDYFTSYVYYRKVLDVEPQRTDIYFKYAESARLFQAYRVAEDAYRNITESEDADNFPLAMYWLASMKKNLGDHAGAKALFKRYLDKHKRHNSRFAFRADKDIADCDWAIRNINPNNASIAAKPVEGGVNSPYSEFGAFELDDELYFTSMRFQDEQNENRLYSKLMVKNAAGELETVDWGDKEEFTANAAVNFNGTKIFYTLCSFNSGGQIKCRIVYKEKDFYGGWSDEYELPTHINFPGFTSTHPTIGYDLINEREVLYFASNRPGGKGKLDLWYSHIDATGKFTRPINLSEFNTRENEVTPYFHSETQNLYFSSDGYQGMGGYDIYKAKKEEHFWKKPTHMGFPINSSYNDFYFTVDHKGSKTYFASNRAEALEIDPENEACCNDIFTAEIRPDQAIFDPADIVLPTNPIAEYPTVEVENAEKPEPVKTTPGSISKPIVTIPTPSNNQPKEIPSTNEVVEVPPAKTNIKPSGPVDDIPETLVGNKTTEISGKEIILSKPTKSNNAVTNFDYNALPENLYPISFEVKTYDMDDNQLNQAKVEFVEMINGQRGLNFLIENFSDNTFLFRLKRGVDYQLVLNSPGYFPDTLFIEKEILDGATSPSQKYYMMLDEEATYIPSSPISSSGSSKSSNPLASGFALNQMLPISLFFNEDTPDPNSLKSTTAKSYQETYIFYYSKKEKIKTNYAASFSYDQQGSAADDLDSFFENEVKYGFEQLEIFSQELIEFLDEGNSVEIQLQPVEEELSNVYKASLMQRRVNSIENHFKTFLNRQFLPYLETGRLKITALTPIQNTSKNKDLNYSPEVSRTRRVEIRALRFN